MTTAREWSCADGALRGDRVGAGSTVVLLHGFGLDRSMWDPQLPALAARHDVVRYDLRGFGVSGPPAAGADHVGDLTAVLDALGIDAAHLVGLSLGANVAMTTAVTRPDRVRGLVLISPGLPGHRWRTPRPPDEAAAVARTEGVEAARRFWLAHEIFATARERPDVHRRVVEMVRRFPAAQWAGSPDMAPLPPIVDRLGEVRAPTLVLSGARDVPGYREIAALLAVRIPGAVRTVVSRAGHMASLEEPATVTGRILEFLAAVDARAASVGRSGRPGAVRRCSGGGRDDAPAPR